MGKRRTHSSIDRLPAALRETLTCMIVDDYWPDDLGDHYDGKPRYEDIVAYCKSKGHTVSSSAVGRFAMQVRTITRMKNAGLLARETMAGLTAENAPKTQKAASEMATALVIEFMASHDEYSSKQLKEVCQAIRDCTQVSIKADQYIRQQIEVKIKSVDKNIKAFAAKKEIDPEALKYIREQIYGIVD